jgi:peptidylprolyl isomerase domain and WD repeat-containing protein 1
MVFMIGGVQVAQDLQRSDVPLYRLDAIDFGRRIAVEKEIEKTDGVPSPNAVFDESSNFLLYPALLGIKAKYLCLFFWQSMWFSVRM